MGPQINFIPCLFSITLSRIVNKQEDARGRLRGMCGFKKELRVCWMAMES